MPIKKFLFYFLFSAIIFNTNCLPIYGEVSKTKASGSTLKDDALFEAVLEGDAKKAAELIKKGAFAGKKYDGKSLLIFALRDECQDVAKLLIQKGADQNASDSSNMTVLMYAAEKGNKEIVDLLLSKGAIASSKDSSGRIALMYALEGYQHEGANKSSVDYLGIVKTLLSKCNDINYRDHAKETLLMYAVRARWPEAVKLLLSSRSIQVNFKNYEENTALDIAQQELYPSITSLRAVEDAHSKAVRSEIIDMLKKAGARSKLTR